MFSEECGFFHAKPQGSMKAIPGGVTLLEIVIVIVIVGILGGIGILSTSRTEEKAIDREAKTTLKLIQKAESFYNIENSSYYPSSGCVSSHAQINDNLKVYLPVSVTNWNYTVCSTGCVTATRNGDDGRGWYLKIDTANGDPVSGTGCP